MTAYRRAHPQLTYSSPEADQPYPGGSKRSALREFAQVVYTVSTEKILPNLLFSCPTYTLLLPETVYSSKV